MHPESEIFTVHNRSLNTLDKKPAHLPGASSAVCDRARCQAARLNVPGRKPTKSHHRFIEPYPYVRKEALVVGAATALPRRPWFLSEEAPHRRWPLA